MKSVASIVLVVALIAEIAAFFAVGFGIGALNAAAPGNPNPSSYFPSWNNASQTGGALDTNVWVNMAEVPFVSSIQAGDPSTTLSFGVQVKSNNNCGNAGDPAWAGGGTSPSWYSIQFNGGASTDYTIGGYSNGQPTLAAGSYQTNTLIVSYNGTSNGGATNPYLFYCFYNAGQSSLSHGNVQSSNFGNVIFGFTLSIVGQASGSLTVTFHSAGSLCTGSNAPGTGGGDCSSASVAANGAWGYSGHIWSSAHSVSVPLMDGQASVATVGNGPWFNGKSISFEATTGFGGVNGYQLAIDNPAARGGGIASGWTPANPMTVGNNLAAGSVLTFTIPAGASVNCTAAGCNQFQAVLSSPYISGKISFPIDISPLYAPGQPNITSSVSSGTLYPAAGDTLTLTFTSTETGNNQTPASFLLEVFYLLPSESVDQSQTCGQQWVTSPPCQAISISAGAAGANRFTATYSFTVNPTPLQATAIGVVVQAESTNQQSSAISRTTISIAPTNCPAGSVCNPRTSGITAWLLWAPILVSAMIATAALLAVMWVPYLPARVAILIVAGVVIVLFYVLGAWTLLFGAGGPLA